MSPEYAPTSNFLLTIAEKFQFALKWKEELTSDKFKLNFFKVLSDGTLENGSAACPNPYPQTGAKVSPAFTEDQEYEYMIKSYENGLDYNIHAIGPDAVHRVLMAVKMEEEENKKFKEYREQQIKQNEEMDLKYQKLQEEKSKRNIRKIIK